MTATPSTSLGEGTESQDGSGEEQRAQHQSSIIEGDIDHTHIGNL